MVNANSAHPNSQILGIARVVALRLWRICSENDDFYINSKEYCQYLVDCGHNKEHVFNIFNQVGCMTREEARKNKPKVSGNHCVFC